MLDDLSERRPGHRRSCEVGHPGSGELAKERVDVVDVLGERLIGLPAAPFAANRQRVHDGIEEL